MPHSLKVLRDGHHALAGHVLCDELKGRNKYGAWKNDGGFGKERWERGSGRSGKGKEWEEPKDNETDRSTGYAAQSSTRHVVMLSTNKGTYGLRLRWGWAGRARRVLATRKVHLHQHLQRLLFPLSLLLLETRALGTLSSSWRQARRPAS